MNVRGALSLLGASVCVAVFGVCTRLVSPTFGAISQNALRFAGAAQHGGAIAEADVTISITADNEKGSECPAASNSDPAHAAQPPVSFVRRPAQPGNSSMRGTA
jgi:hypothetical protein